ncbi:hypothetical protein QT971_11235, partial [Microcoleus sp. herbarium19]|uniref:hypothetical protein n=1 Tax=unclassified Microcoleus TaxID=2642155 RepID=UPI002FD29B94
TREVALEYIWLQTSMSGKLIITGTLLNAIVADCQASKTYRLLLIVYAFLVWRIELLNEQLLLVVPAAKATAVA